MLEIIGDGEELEKSHCSEVDFVKNGNERNTHIEVQFSQSPATKGSHIRSWSCPEY